MGALLDHGTGNPVGWLLGEYEKFGFIFDHIYVSAIEFIKPEDVLDSLTPREFEVFRLLANGLSLDEIANTLNLNYKTIANIQTRLLQKVHVENRSQLILAAVRLNIVES